MVFKVDLLKETRTILKIVSGVSEDSGESQKSAEARQNKLALQHTIKIQIEELTQLMEGVKTAVSIRSKNLPMLNSESELFLGTFGYDI